MTDANTKKSDAEMQQAWREHNLSQLQYFNSLSLRAKLQAVEGMADVVRRFQQLRAEGKIHSASSASKIHETANQYNSTSNSGKSTKSD